MYWNMLMQITSHEYTRPFGIVTELLRIVFFFHIKGRIESHRLAMHCLLIIHCFLWTVWLYTIPETPQRPPPNGELLLTISLHHSCIVIISNRIQNYFCNNLLLSAIREFCGMFCFARRALQGPSSLSEYLLFADFLA